MKKFLAFIVWIFVKLGKNLAKQHQEFKYTLRHQIGYGVFVWGAFTCLSTIANLLLGAIFVGCTGIQITGLYIIVWVGLCVAYFLFTGVSLMYNSFEAERAQLFETIKNGR